MSLNFFKSSYLSVKYHKISKKYGDHGVIEFLWTLSVPLFGPRVYQFEIGSGIVTYQYKSSALAQRESEL